MWENGYRRLHRRSVADADDLMSGGSLSGVRGGGSLLKSSAASKNASALHGSLSADREDQHPLLGLPSMQ
ncbi:MAG: hypothetical protein EOO65_04175 [Methanosarcinales archaeon]|nr:MAG: hypothetical protein EOO65_04175 [Methanosarcinales archaeon]